MLNTLMFVCSFIFIIIIKYNVRATETSSKLEQREVVEANWGEKKFLVVLDFGDNQCLGALVSARSLVTSKICLDFYKFSSKISEKPCKVLAGSQETVGKDLGIWRFCSRPRKSIWSDYNLDYTKRGIRKIRFDFPFADMEEASVGDPPFGGNYDCEVHGFSSGKGAAPSAESESKISPEKPEQPPPKPAPEPSAKYKRHTSNHSTEAEGSQSVINKSGLEESQEISNNKSSSNIVTPVKEDTKSKSKVLRDGAMIYKKTKAKILSMGECTKLYKENMNVDLPPDQFCVSEGGIKDPGRLLICNDKIVGIVADDLVIKKDRGGVIYAYKFATSNRLILDPKVVWSLVTVHFVYKIFSSPFNEHENFFSF